MGISDDLINFWKNKKINKTEDILKKMADVKACRPNILRAVGWIALKSDVVVLCVFQVN